MILGLLLQSTSQELWASVTEDLLRVSPIPSDLIQDAYHIWGRNGSIGGIPQHFPIELIDHIECSERLTGEQGITH